LTIDRARLEPLGSELHCQIEFNYLSINYSRHEKWANRAGETLGAMLLSDTNIAYYQFLMQAIRNAIAHGTFEEFYQRTREDWARGDIAPR